MSKIKIYIHAMDLPSGHDILANQVHLLESTGLMDEADEINVMCHFDKKNFQWLKNRWFRETKVKYYDFDDSYRNWYEHTTVHQIQEDAHSTIEDYYVLYIHPKGISHPPGGHQNWRKYMEYWNIERWRECVAALNDGYDTAGASYLHGGPTEFYAGNTYWAKASYLRRCKRMLTPDVVGFKPQFDTEPHHRFDVEVWHGSGKPKFFDIHPGPDKRWYWPPEAYRADLTDKWIYRP
ncbi:hypothetical protein UFOVP250_141 [uncultured Caudovirales phage]|uniref:Uncharacterized protein n=1 Tax=uncultured Caudovirales phage TaxID=2100421 RepID=A0A6J5LF98_9CAUD|nr:hypothetical protein UFOVP250_141 [uncultured Caudovirales phage]